MRYHDIIYIILKHLFNIINSLKLDENHAREKVNTDKNLITTSQNYQQWMSNIKLKYAVH
jgi:hypothetical protein